MMCVRSAVFSQLVDAISTGKHERQYRRTQCKVQAVPCTRAAVRQNLSSR
jgi:hypothetical protein